MDGAALQKLALWLSPGWPVGGFAFSHGLEWAVAEGPVRDAGTARGWIEGALRHGAGRTDAILAAAAWRDPESEEPAALARALAASAERLAETEAIGAAFAAVTSAAFGPALAAAPFPVVFGRAARAHKAPLVPALTLFLQAFAANLMSAAVRLVPLGQTEGAKALAALLPACADLAREAAEAPLDAAGGAALLSDIAAMRHETLPVRLFRT